MNPSHQDDIPSIQNLLSTYAYAVDRKDWALYRTVFTDDAQLDYTSAPFGIAGPLDKVVAWLSQSLALIPLTMHYITNVHTDVSETDALVRAQFFNPIQFPGTDEMSYCGGYYHHHLVRTNSGWRSSYLREENVWFANSPFADE